MESYYIWAVVLLCCIVALKLIGRQLQQKQDSAAHAASSAAESESFLSKAPQKTDDKAQAEMDAKFKKFQYSYVLIFLTVMLADWMQGPYVYKLYAKYGYAPQEIAVLFIVGFGVSGLCGTFVGSFADRFGRKLTCLLFCVCYTVCCITKHFHSFPALMLGRFLGGISTSILFSCFEAWMVSHHSKQGFPMQKLGSTFGLAWGMNSIIAVCAGFITSFAVSVYDKYDVVAGPAEIAAFDCSAAVLMVALALIAMLWTENTGDPQISATQALNKTVVLFQTNLNVSLLGCIQSGFESGMYLFVFMWTLALEELRGDDAAIDHGLIFAVFMEACFVGTLLSGLLSGHHWGYSSERIGVMLCMVAAVALLIVPYTTNYELRLLCFIVFEGCVGVYFPTIGTLRGKYVPENLRATVMNVFRVPLNVIVVLALWYLNEIGMHIFKLSASCLVVAALAAYSLSNQSQNEKKTVDVNMVVADNTDDKKNIV